MTSNTQHTQNKSPMSGWKAIGLLFISFFLLIMLLTTFFLIPQVNKELEKTHQRDLKTALRIEVEFFKRFIKNHKKQLEDIARYPALTNAVMLSSAESNDLISFFNNTKIDNQRGNLVLQDILGNVLITSSDALLASYSGNQPWFEQILNGEIRYHFSLLASQEKMFNFKISVPVIYRGNVEGVLSTELKVPLDSVFFSQAFENTAFMLKQNNLLVKTEYSNFTMPREISQTLPELGISYSYIKDDKAFAEKQDQIKNTIFLVIFIGLAMSFVVFFIISYRSSSLEQQTKTNQKSLFNRDNFQMLIVALVGIAASVAGGVIFKNLQIAQAKKNIAAFAIEHTDQIKKQIAVNDIALDALQAFYNASNFVDREEFRIFTEVLLEKYADIQGLGWLPNVKRHQREEFEKNTQAAGFKDFSIRQWESGTIAPESRATSYYPILYVEPSIENTGVIGLDAASEAKRFAAIKQAELTGRKTATAPMSLSHKNHLQMGVVVFNPVYTNQKPNPTADVSASQKNLQGFVAMVLRTESMVEKSFTEQLDNFSLQVEDITDTSNPLLLYASSDHAELMQRDFSFSSTIELAGRQWRVTWIPHKQMITEQLSRLADLIIWGGILFTLFICFMLLQQIRRREMIESVIEQRTGELAKTSELNKAILHSSKHLIISTDSQGMVTQFNKAAQAALGYSGEEIIGKQTPAIWHDKEEVLQRAVELSNEFDQTIQPGFDVFTFKAKKFGTETREWTFIRKNGEKFSVYLTVTCIYSQQQEITGYLGVIEDITALKTEEESRFELQHAMQLAVDGVAKIDAEGQYIYVNDAYAAKFGYTSVDLIDKHWEGFFAPGELHSLRTSYQQMLTDGKVIAEIIIDNKDGSSSRQRINLIAQYDNDGEFAGHFCFLQQA